jgi:hypothetical protein
VVKANVHPRDAPINHESQSLHSILLLGSHLFYSPIHKEECLILRIRPHQGLNFWNQNDSFLNQNDHASKRSFFIIRSKIPHKFGNLVLICESQSNQGRPCLTWDLGFAFIDQMVLVNNWPQVIDQFDV